MLPEPSKRGLSARRRRRSLCPRVAHRWRRGRSGTSFLAPAPPQTSHLAFTRTPIYKFEVSNLRLMRPAVIGRSILFYFFFSPALTSSNPAHSFPPLSAARLQLQARVSLADHPSTVPRRRNSSPTSPPSLSLSLALSLSLPSHRGCHLVSRLKTPSLEQNA